MKPYVFLAFAIATEVLGTTALKESAGMTRLVPATLVIVCYGLSFWLLSQTLLTLPVAMVYAVWCGVGVAAIAIIGQVAFDEPITLTGALGMGLIVAGIVLLQLPGRAAA